MKKRSVLFILLIAFLTLPLFANGSAESDSQETKEEKVLRIAWWTNEERTKITNEIFDLYTSQNPGLVIEPEFSGWGGYWDKLSIQAAAGNLADIIQMDLYGYMGLYAGKGQIVDLTPYVESGLLDLSQIDKGPLENATIDGKLYGVPLGASPQAAIINPQILEEVGLELPKPGYTWEDYEKMGEVLAANGYYLDSFQINNLAYEFEYYVRSYGEEYFSAEGSLGFSRETLVNYLEMKKRLTEKKIIPEPGILRQHQELENSLMVIGKAAMFSDMWASQLSAIESAAGKDLVLIPRPNGDRSGMYNKPAMYFSLTTDAVNPEEAVKFMNFWINDPEPNKIGTTNRGVPCNSAVREAIAPGLDQQSIEIVDYIAQVNDMFGPLPPNKPVQEPEISELFSSLVEKVCLNMLAPEEAADQFLTKAEGMLK
ncbi:MAG: ABC transporter substrate-binding protein [Spirochaetales bacterium]|nr:ABC transporter substrate-binding protein [Spirochaetales bacterium]